jgi:hypothetical protein
MIGVFWDIRGLNKTGRLQCISDFIKEHRLDFVGVQETKKTIISDAFLQSTCKDMDWKTAGGILVGVKKAFADIVSWKWFQFCSVMVLKNQLDEFVWRLVVVYGSPYDDSKS